MSLAIFSERLSILLLHTSIDIEQYSSDFEVGTVCSHLKLGISPRHSLWRWKEGVHQSGIGQGVAL